MPATPSTMAIDILHTNDFHGTLDAEAAARLRQMKGASGGFLFDSGDCIRTGNLGIPLRQEAAWEHLAAAGCDAGVLGNRETHVLESAFMAKIQGARHPLLCANLVKKDGSRPLPSHLILQHPDGPVGVVAAMVPMVTRRMASRAASAYLWDPPVEALQPLVRELRPQVQLLLALTHIGYKQDLELARALPEVDVILGGHSHTVLEVPVREGTTWICQGGSHGRFVGRYRWTDGELHGQLEPLRTQTPRAS